MAKDIEPKLKLLSDYHARISMVISSAYSDI